MTQRLSGSFGVPTPTDEEQEDLFDYFYDQPGTIPGTISIDEDARPSTIVLIDYNQEQVRRMANLTPEACGSYLETNSVSWIDVLGLGSEDILKGLSQVFKLHPLVLEDLVNVPQRPKVENYEEQLVVITQMVMPKEKASGFWIEQVSFVLGKHYLLTFQEEPERDCFSRVRKRIRHNQGIIRKRQADYLAYALWDAIIDSFFPVLEAYGEQIDELEDEVVINPTNKTLAKIYQLKRELLALRRVLWPQRDAISTLIRDPSPLISPDVQIYLRDCYDHTVELLDIMSTYRELASSLMDVYLSSVSNKMNEVMKLLTVISTIFIPLTFVAGIYGMNFNPEASPWNMPELNWYWGYPLCWAVMIVIASGLIYFFWRCGWFSSFSKINKG